MIKTPKLHLCNTGLACALLGIDSKSLRKQADWHEHNLNFYHYRDKDKVEVDIIIEQGQQLAGIEIKAAGVVFYDGDSVLPFGKGLFAVPLSALIPRTAITQR